MSDSRVDRNLLFGVLALQMDFINRDALIAAMNAWALEKSKPLGQILLERKALSEDEHKALSAVVAKHIERHDGDPRQSLIALGPLGDVERDLERMADADVHATLAGLTRARPEPAETTLPPRTQSGDGERFEILRSHAWGGLGEVFVAQDHELNREVALKKLHERHAGDDNSRTRFLAEAEITGGLEHPGIVPVYGLGTHHDGQAYYAMRFIRGETLKDAIARFHADDKQSSSQRRVELRQLLSRFIAVCNAIGYAHSRGVLHRDIKPSNIMLGKYGETLVVDWGLAKAQGRRDDDAPTSERTLVPSSGGSSETLPGSAIGTPAFMSPEQAEGRIEDLGPTSDVYSLGATLYTILTGAEPFEGEVVGVVLANVQKGQFLPPRRRNPRVSPALEAICLKAMRLSRWERYPSCAALASDVEHWLADEPVTAYSEPMSARAARWIKRNRGWAAASAALLAAAFVGLIVGTAFLSSSNTKIAAEAKKADDERIVAEKQTAVAVEQTAEAKRQRQLAEEQRKLAEERELTARHYLYAAQMILAQQAWERGQVGRVMELLNGQRPQPGQQDLRGFGWYYLWRLCHSELRTIPSHRGTVWSVAISGDGKTLAIASQDIELWDLESSTQRATLGGNNGDINGVVFSPDDKIIASANADSTIRLWDAKSGTELATLRAEGAGQMNGVAFSPDGKSLVTGSSDGAVRLWNVPAFPASPIPANPLPANPLSQFVKGLFGGVDAPGKTPLQPASEVLAGHRGEVNGVAYSPDGKLVASAGTDKTVRLWDVATRRLRTTLVGHTDAAGPVVFSPDGKTLASGSDDMTVKLWDVPAGKEVSTLSGHTDWIEALAYSADGMFLASGARDSTVTVWRLSDVPDAAQRAVDVPQVAAEPVSARSEPATARRSFSKWTVFKGHKLQVSGLAFTRDGQMLASGSHDATAKLWNVTQGQENVTLYGHQGRNYCVAFSPDGKLVASGSDDLTVKLWDVATRRHKATLSGHAARVKAVCFSPDAKTLASTAWDNTIKLWDVTTGRERTQLTPHIATSGLAFSPDGKTLAACGSLTVTLWDAAKGRRRAALNGHTGSTRGVAFAPDGKTLASCSEDMTIKLWDARTGKLKATLLGHTGGVLSVAFSPDGQTLASGGGVNDKTVRLWDIATGKSRLTLLGHSDIVNNVAFSPDGKLLATASSDGTVKLWDVVKDWRDNIILRGHTTIVQASAFSPDSKTLATTSFDQTVKLWNIGAASEADVIAFDAPFHPPNSSALEGLSAKDCNNQAWGLARDRNIRPATADMAVELATKAVGLAPESGLFLNTLGVAQYRAGKYADAIETLLHSDERNRPSMGGPLPADIAFLAMAHHRLGHADPAAMLLQQLRELMRTKPWKDKEESKMFLKEALELISPNGAAPAEAP